MALTTNSCHKLLFNPEQDYDGDDVDSNGYRNVSIFVDRHHYQEGTEISDSEEERTKDMDSDDDFLCVLTETSGSGSEHAIFEYDNSLSHRTQRRAAQEINQARRLKRNKARPERRRAHQQAQVGKGRPKRQHKPYDSTDTNHEARRAARKERKKARRAAVKANPELKAANRERKKARTARKELRRNFRASVTSCLLLLTLLMSKPQYL